MNLLYWHIELGCHSRNVVVETYRKLTFVLNMIIHYTNILFG